MKMGLYDFHFKKNEGLKVFKVKPMEEIIPKYVLIISE